MRLREQRGAQVGPEPQSDTLLPPCCFTYVDAARLPLSPLLSDSHARFNTANTRRFLFFFFPPSKGAGGGIGVGVGALFLSFCLFRENKLAASHTAPPLPTPSPSTSCFTASPKGCQDVAASCVTRRVHVEVLNILFPASAKSFTSRQANVILERRTWSGNISTAATFVNNNNGYK